MEPGSDLVHTSERNAQVVMALVGGAALGVMFAMVLTRGPDRQVIWAAPNAIAASASSPDTATVMAPEEIERQKLEAMKRRWEQERSVLLSQALIRETHARLALERLLKRQKSDLLGDVFRYEVVKENDSETQLIDVTIVEGDATTENQAVLNSLRDIALEAFPDGKWFSTGPDAPHRAIRLYCENRLIDLISWHPVFEERPGAVGASYGITGLKEGQSREEFLAEDDQAYVKQRRAFDEIQEALRKVDAAK